MPDSLVSALSALGHTVPISHDGMIQLLALAFDVAPATVNPLAVHGGITLAIALHFRRDLAGMVVGLYRLVRGKPNPDATLLLMASIAAAPVILAAGLVALVGEAMVLAAPILIVFTVSLAGLALLIADITGMRVRRLEHLTLADAVIIGVVQALAWIPGVGRVLACIAAGRVLGLERAEAARFALLSALPMMLIAGLAFALLLPSGSLLVGDRLGVQAVIAFSVAFLAIALLMRWLTRGGFVPFAALSLAIGVALVALSL